MRRTSYTAALFAPYIGQAQEGLRIPFETQWQAIACAKRAIAEGRASFANVIRRDRLGRSSYIWHGEAPKSPAA